NAMATEGHRPWSLASSATMAVLAWTEGGTGRDGQSVSVRGIMLYFIARPLLCHSRWLHGGWRRLVHTVRVTVRRDLRNCRSWGLCVLGQSGPNRFLLCQ